MKISPLQVIATVRRVNMPPDYQSRLRTLNVITPQDTALIEPADDFGSEFRYDYDEQGIRPSKDEDV